MTDFIGNGYLDTNRTLWKLFLLLNCSLKKVIAIDSLMQHL